MAVGRWRISIFARGRVQGDGAVIRGQSLRAIGMFDDPFARQMEADFVAIGIGSGHRAAVAVLFIGSDRVSGRHGRGVIGLGVHMQERLVLDLMRGTASSDRSLFMHRPIGGARRVERCGCTRSDGLRRDGGRFGGHGRRGGGDNVWLGRNGGMDLVGSRSRQLEIVDLRDLGIAANMIDGDGLFGGNAGHGRGIDLNLGGAGGTGMDVGQTADIAIADFHGPSHIQPRLAEILLVDALQVCKVVEILMGIIGNGTVGTAGLIAGIVSHCAPHQKKCPGLNEAWGIHSCYLPLHSLNFNMDIAKTPKTADLKWVVNNRQPKCIYRLVLPHRGRAPESPDRKQMR